MFYIGCHLSAAKGYLAMGKEAVKLGANVFQLGAIWADFNPFWPMHPIP